jgi:hypothetical protein
MALNKKRDAEMEALIQRGAAEIKRLNPHIGEAPQPYTEEELQELEEMDAELERLWNSPEGQRAQQPGYTAAQAVSEDRGE